MLASLPNRRRSNRTAQVLLATVLGGWFAQAGWAQTAPPAALNGHTAPVSAALFTPNQKFVVSGAADQTVRIWDAATGNEVRKLTGHTGTVLSLAVPPDGAVVVSGAADNSLRVWDVPRAEPLRAFADLANARGVAVSPAGLWSVAFGGDKIGRVVKLEDGTTLFPLAGHAAEPLVSAVRADNNQIASGDADGIVVAWSTLDGQPQGRVGAHAGPVRGLTFLPNNQQLVSAGDEGLVKVWQLPFANSRTLAGHNAAVSAVALNSDGQLVMTGADSVRVFNPANGQLVRELAGAGPTQAVAISPNNVLAAAAGDAGTIRLWNLADGADRLTLLGHEQPIHALAFHPDNVRLASAGADGTVRLWKLPTPPVTVAGHTADVVSVAVSANGQLAATASADKSVRLWNPTNGQPLRTLSGHEQPLSRVALRSDSGQVASGDAAGELRLWSAADGAGQGTLGAHAGALLGVAYHPAGDKLATVGGDGLIKVWKLPPRPPLALGGHAEAVTAVALTSDGKNVVTGGADKTVRVYDATTGQQTRAFAEVPDAVTSLAISRNDALTAAGTASGVIKFFVYRPAEGAGAPSLAANELTGHDGAVLDLAFDAAAQSIVSAGADGTIRLWRLPTAPVVIRDAAGPSGRFVVSPDGKLAAVAGAVQDKPAIFVRELPSGKILSTLLGHEAAITSLAFHRDGTKLASGSADKTARVWNLADAKFPESSKVTHATPVTAVTLSADGTQLFAAAGDNAVYLWSVADGSAVRTLPGHTAAIAALAVAGPTLISGSADGSVRLWNTQTGAAIRSLNHGGAVTSVAVASNGQTLASAGADKQVKLWNVADGAAVATLAGHTVAVAELAFHSDGSRLVSVAGDGVFLWDVAGKRRWESFAWPATELRGVGFVGESLAVGVADGSVRIVTSHLTRLIAAHVGGANAVALSPDGTKVVSGGADKSVKAWTLADGKPWATFAGPTESVTSVAFASAGKHVLAAGVDKFVRVWPLPAAAAPQPVAAEKQWEFAAPIRSVHVNGDGTRAALGGDDRVVRVWDLMLGRELERFVGGHTAGVTDVAISTDGKTVVSGSADKSARLSALSLSHVVAVAEPRAVAFAPDGQLVAAAGMTLSRWKVGDAALEPAAPFAPAPAKLVELAVRPDGKQLAALDETGRVHVWDADGKVAFAIAPVEPLSPGTPRGGLQFSADNSKLVVGLASRTRVFDVVYRPAGGAGSATNVATPAGASGWAVNELARRLLQKFDEPSAVTSVAFAPDNATLLVGRVGPQNNAAFQTLALERLLPAHEGPVRGLAFTPDGTGLASGGDDKLVRLWNVADGKLVRTYAGVEGAIQSLAISKDAGRLVAGGADKSVRVWPLVPPAPSEPVPPTATFRLPAAVSSVSISADNLKLAASSSDGVVRVLELASGRELQRFAESAQPALAVAFAPDSRTLVSGGADKAVRVLTMSLVRSFAASDSPLLDLALANAGAQAVTVGKDGVKQWNLADGSLVRRFAETPFVSVAARPDNGQLAAVDAEQNLVLWNPATGQAMATVKVPAAVQQVRYSPDGLKLVTACADQRLRFFDPATGTPTYELASEKPLAGVVFAPDSRSVLTGGEPLRQWLYASPTAVRTLVGHGGAVNGVTFSPDGRWIASASADQTVRLWDAATGTQAKQFAGHVGAVYSVAFSPDGSLLVSSGLEPGLRLWDTLGGRQLKQIAVGESGLYSVAFFPDGKRVAAAGLDRKIYVVDVLTGQLQSTLERHVDYLYRVAINKSGTRLLSCGYGGHVMLWNATNGQHLFATRVGRVANFADLAPNGERIVVAGGDARVHIADVPANVR